MELKQSSHRDKSEQTKEEPDVTRIGYMVLRRGEDVLLLKRKKTGRYSLPAGHIEAGETPIVGAIREAFEEVGVKVHADDASFVHHIRLDEGTTDDEKLVDFYFFETQKWEGEPLVMENDVHEKILWVNIDSLPENIHPNMRKVLEERILAK